MRTRSFDASTSGLEHAPRTLTDWNQEKGTKGERPGEKDQGLRMDGGSGNRKEETDWTELTRFSGARVRESRRCGFCPSLSQSIPVFASPSQSVTPCGGILIDKVFLPARVNGSCG